jgi:hypothetical protein
VRPTSAQSMPRIRHFTGPSVASTLLTVLQPSASVRRGCARRGKTSGVRAV